MLSHLWMRIKSVVLTKIVEFLSGKIQHACDNPVLTLDDNIIASPSSASSLNVHGSTISLRCHMRSIVDNVIHCLEWCLQAVTDEALPRMPCKRPAFWGRVGRVIHTKWLGQRRGTGCPY